MKRSILTAISVVLMTGSLASAQQRGEIVPLPDLPVAVRKAADTATDEVKWLVSFRFVEFFRGSNQTWYRIVGRDAGQNRLVKAMVLKDGEVLDVRTDIQMREVPRIVRTAVNRQFPGFTVENAEAVGKSMKSTIYYRFEGAANGSKFVVISRADGAKVFQEGQK